MIKISNYRITYNEVPGEYQKIISYTFGSGHPKVYMQAAIHGNETVGSLVLEKLINDLKKEKSIKGTVTIVPFANPFSLGAKHLGQYVGRHDIKTSKNWNRCFPGNRKGDIVDRLCFTIFNMFKDYDYVFDIHNMNLWKSVIYGINSKRDSITKSMGLRYTEINSTPPKDSLRFACRENGIWSITLEVGNSFFIMPDEYNYIKNSLLSALGSIGITGHGEYKSKHKSSCWFRKEDKRTFFAEENSIVFLPTPPKTIPKGALVYKAFAGESEKNVYSSEKCTILRSKLVHYAPLKEALVDVIRHKKLRETAQNR